MINTTKVQITNVEDLVTFNDDFSVEEVRDMLSGAYTFLDNCVASVTEEDGVRLIIFTESVGTKGAPLQ